MAQSKSPKLPKFSGLFDPKFDIALNLRPAYHFRHRLRSGNKDHLNLTEVKRLLDHHTLDDLKACNISVKCIGHLFHIFMSQPTPSGKTELHDYVQLATKVTTIQEEHYLSNTSMSLKQDILNLIKEMNDNVPPIPKEVQFMFQAVQEMDKVLELFQYVKEVNYKSKDETPNFITLYGGRVKFTLSRSLLEFQLL